MMIVVAIILCGTVLFLGYRVGNKLLLPHIESERDPLILRPYAFEIDIAEGAIESSVISSSQNNAIISKSVKEVCNRRLGGFRIRRELKLNRVVHVSEDSRKRKILKLLVQSDLATSEKQRREITTQIQRVKKPGETIGAELSVITLSTD